MNAIVVVCSDWGIGYKGCLLVDNKVDMKHFVSLTTGGTVVMGRATFESFSHGALPHRRNIVISSDKSYVAPGAEVVHSISELLECIGDTAPDKVWLIGGGSLYKTLLPLCAKAYVTYAYTEKPADTWFPNLDDDIAWRLAETSEPLTTPQGITFEFRVYENLEI